MESRDRFGFILEKAKQLGADRVDFIPAKSLNERTDAEIAPEAVWPRARTVIILAIRTSGDSAEAGAIEDSILNGMAYTLASWLTGRGVASVYMPRGDALKRYFPSWAAGAAELNDFQGGEYRTVSVLSSIEQDS